MTGRSLWRSDRLRTRPLADPVNCWRRRAGCSGLARLGAAHITRASIRRAPGSPAPLLVSRVMGVRVLVPSGRPPGDWNPLCTIPVAERERLDHRSAPPKARVAGRRRHSSDRGGRWFPVWPQGSDAHRAPRTSGRILPLGVRRPGGRKTRPQSAILPTGQRPSAE
jgi:hypothetical protein